MNFWWVKHVQKYYNCINPSLSTVKKFYAMLLWKYYGSTTLALNCPLFALLGKLSDDSDEGMDESQDVYEMGNYDSSQSYLDSAQQQQQYQVCL